MKSSLGLFYCIRCFGFASPIGFASSDISDDMNPKKFILSDGSDGINLVLFAMSDDSDGLNLRDLPRPKFG